MSAPIPKASHVPFEDGPFRALLTSGGDVLAARACAQSWLNALPTSPRPQCGARLLLTAICLHLYPVAGPDPTLADVYGFLTDLGQSHGAARAALANSPIGLVRYVAEEFDAGCGSGTQATLHLAMQAVAASIQRVGPSR